MGFTTSVWWLKFLYVSFSLRTGPFHFWSVFSPGPAAERRRLETSAGPCPSPHPETGKQHVCFVATLAQHWKQKKKGGRLEPCNYLTSAKGGAVSLFMSLTVLIGHTQLLTIWTYTRYFSWKYASVDKTPEAVTAKVQNQICVTSAEMSRLFSCFDFF